MIERPDINSTLMAIAHVWEDRSTCSRNQVGCVIAREGRIIGSGYNGAPAGMDHCVHELPLSFPIPVGRRATPPELVERLKTPGYDRGCKLAIHAEANALAYAARHGVSVEGATIYTTLSPCYPCAQLIIAAGLSSVVFNRSYRDPAGTDLLQQAGVVVTSVKGP